MNRREWLLSSTAALGSAARATAGSTPKADRAADPFVYCLNTSTLSGFKLSLDEELRLAADVGYQAVEPWVSEIEAYRDGGKRVEDLAKRVRDLGLSLPSVIGFFDWVVDDDAKRRAGFENAKRSMELVRALGGSRIAAPPVGGTDRDDIALDRIADRYAELLAIGRECGVTPLVELWGFSKTLGTLADAAYVAIASGQPDALILPDVYHMYKGGTPPRGLRMVNGKAMPAIHMNDYPADPPRERISDAHRVYPGDGVAPIGDILRDLRDIGFEGALSLELFNREYWKQDPATVARTGLRKMKEVVHRAFTE